jgi:mannitol/fructose-specific phosphotransferase system IIA component (Ntr-type)
MNDLWENLKKLAAPLGFLLADVPIASCRSVETAIRFLVAYLIAAGALPADQADAAVQALLLREQKGSTGVGRELALPHAAVSFVDRVIGVLAHAPVAVPWHAVDGQDVRIILLMLTPAGRPGESLRTMEALAQALQQN